MDLNIKINNIGKLRNAQISVRPLTLLAGPNSTGKSFFSKTLYSTLHAMNDNYISSYVKLHLNKLSSGLRYIQFCFERKKHFERMKFVEVDAIITLLKIPNIKQKTDETLPSIKNAIKLCNTITRKGQLLTYKEDHLKIKNCLNKIIELPLLQQLNDFKTTQTSRRSVFLDMEVFANISESIKNLKKIIDSIPEDCMNIGFNNTLKNNLIGNFQIPTTHNLLGNVNKPASIKIENIGAISINEGNYIKSNLSIEGFVELQKKSQVIYLESPVHWKLKNALSRVSDTYRLAQNRPARRSSLLIPKYFKDLNEKLLENWSGDMAFPDIFKKLTQGVIKGKITIDESGTLQFTESQKSHSLPSTASGIVQLGILALLIEKKLLDKNSVLFIDEPETNLHPAWQVKMMEVLFQLVKNGVHIILATHSVDIIKWLEVHISEEDHNLIALNAMTVNEDGTASTIPKGSNMSIQEQIRNIQKNLAEPYLDLFLKGRNSNGD